MQKLNLLLSLILTSFAFPNIAEASTIILNDNFDTENNGNPILNYEGFANWDVTNGAVDLIGNGFFDFFPGNGLYLDLDGTVSNAGRLESKSIFSFNSGDIINLSFDIFGQNPQTGGLNNEVTVTLGNFIDEIFTVADSETITRQIQVTSPTSTNLIFDHAGGDNGGLILDNVRLSVDSQTTIQTTPESSIFIGLLSFGGLSLAIKFNTKPS